MLFKQASFSLSETATIHVDSRVFFENLQNNPWIQDVLQSNPHLPSDCHDTLDLDRQIKSTKLQSLAKNTPELERSPRFFFLTGFSIFLLGIFWGNCTRSTNMLMGNLTSPASGKNQGRWHQLRGGDDHHIV